MYGRGRVVHAFALATVRAAEPRAPPSPLRINHCFKQVNHTQRRRDPFHSLSPALEWSTEAQNWFDGNGGPTNLTRATLQQSDMRWRVNYYFIPTHVLPTTRRRVCWSFLDGGRPLSALFAEFACHIQLVTDPRERK